MARTPKASVNTDRLVKLLRSGGDDKHSVIAEKLGVTPSQLDMMTFHRARLAAGIIKKAPATEKSVRQLRDGSQLRWEEIAARIGLGVAATKTLYEEGGGDLENTYIGRGRDHNADNGGGTPKRSTTKRGAAASGKRGATKRGASKRSSAKAGSAKRSSKKSAAAPTRARTRAQRAARASGNPS